MHSAVHWVSYLSLHLHAVCPFMARCAMGLRGTCHAVVKVYYIRGMVYYRYTTYVGLYTTYGGSCNMDCMQCALCVISSRSASELNCDGMRAARNTSFHRSPTLPTFVFFSRNGAGHFQDIYGFVERIERGLNLHTEDKH